MSLDSAFQKFKKIDHEKAAFCLIIICLLVLWISEKQSFIGLCQNTCAQFNGTLTHFDGYNCLCQASPNAPPICTNYSKTSFAFNSSNYSLDYWVPS